MRVLVGCGRWELIGGSERYALETAAELAQRGHDVSVLTGGGSAPTPRRVLRVDWAPFGDPHAGHAARAELAGILAGAQPDVVLQLTPSAPWISADLLASAPLVRFVQDHTLFCPGRNKLHANGDVCRRAPGRACREHLLARGGCHGLRPRRGALRRIRECLDDLALHRGAARVLVASEYMHNECLRAGLRPGKVEILPYATRAATPAAPSAPPPAATLRFLARAADAPLVLCASRLALPDKGVDYLLTALTLLRGDWRAVIAGDGPAADWLREKARAEGLAERVHFAGWLSAAQVEHLHARARVAVVPSIWDEPFGIAGIEAMAHGVPVVACAVGGVQQWLMEGRGGTLVPPRDVAALAAALARVLGDEDLARLTGAAGRRRVEAEFRPARHYRRLEEVLRGAARAARGGASVAS